MGKPGPRPKPPVDRFWPKVDRSAGDDACWLWTAGVAGKGYGQFYPRKNRPVGAHRFAYELMHGPIPAGMFVCHACDNPPCVNPLHLFLGTAADNNHDTTSKGRNPGNRTSNGRKQFAIKGHDLATARALVEAGTTQRAVAKMFGVSPAAVCRALKAAA